MVYYANIVFSLCLEGNEYKLVYSDILEVDCISV